MQRGAQRLDLSHRPNDDVTHVIKLRNWSVHYRPRTLSVTAQEGLLDHVRGRFGDTPFLGLGEANWWFPDHALSASCAEWAVTSSDAFVREFVTDLGITTSLLDLAWEEAP